MPRDSLGDFEQQVLLVLVRLGGEAYSVPLVLELEERTGKEVAQAAVFIALRRLEKRGLLESRMDHSFVPETGRVRRYFKLTTKGKKKLKEARRTLIRLWDGFEAELDRA